MKKIRIELQPVASGKKTYRLFNSVEALYISLCEKDDYVFDIDESFEISLEKNEFIEVEWLGCEPIYENCKMITLNYVRIAKAKRLSNGTNSISIYVGWIENDSMKFEDTYDKLTTTVRLHNEQDWKLDFRLLFNDEFINEEKAHYAPFHV